MRRWNETETLYCEWNPTTERRIIKEWHRYNIYLFKGKQLFSADSPCQHLFYICFSKLFWIQQICPFLIWIICILWKTRSIYFQNRQNTLMVGYSLKEGLSLFPQCAPVRFTDIRSREMTSYLSSTLKSHSSLCCQKRRRASTGVFHRLHSLGAKVFIICTNNFTI